MKGYLTKQKKGYVFTIVDNSQIKHHYDIFNMEKFCSRFMKESKEIVLQRKSVGQYILTKLGFGFDIELDYLDRDSFVSP
jgi:hypothetical protein